MHPSLPGPFRTAGRLALLLAAAGCGNAPPPADAPPVERPSFDGARAFADVERQVAFGPRVPGTDGHGAQLAWMVETLGGLADTVVVDSFTWTPEGRPEIELRNVLARFGERRRRLLFLAHWDTRPTSDAAATPEERARPVPGANDGASGVAVLLELARMMAADPPSVGVDLLFVDGEDYGPTSDDMFLGARRYARSPAEPRPVYAVLLDMVGDRDPLFAIEGNSADLALDVARRVWGVAHRLGYQDAFPERVGPAVADDHIPLNEARIRTIDVIDLDYGPDNSWWHTAEDTPDKVAPGTLEMVGEVMAELIWQGG